MRKFLAAVLLTAFMIPAHAGFTTGYVVGRSTSDGNSQAATNNKAPAIILSDKHAVIACLQASQPGRCAVNSAGFIGWKYITEIEYVKAHGYSVIHRRGIIIESGTAWIIFEVSK